MNNLNDTFTTSPSDISEDRPEEVVVYRWWHSFDFISVGSDYEPHSHGLSTAETSEISGSSDDQLKERRRDRPRPNRRRRSPSPKPLDNVVVRTTLFCSLFFLFIFLMLSVYILLKTRQVRDVAATEYNGHVPRPSRPTTIPSRPRPSPVDPSQTHGQTSPTPEPSLIASIDDPSAALPLDPTLSPSQAAPSPTTSNATTVDPESEVLNELYNFTLSPSQATRSPTTSNATTLDLESEVLNDLYNFIVTWSPDSFEAIEDPTSSQHQALEWMAQVDGTDYFDRPLRILQRWALATLYFNTNGDEWENSDNWLSNTDECSWYYVRNDEACNDGGYLTAIDLRRNGLHGELPLELTLLSNSLAMLLLTDNDLEGTIPSVFGRLSNLEHLQLGKNDIEGTIPIEIGFLTQLEALGLAQNDLSGTLPSEMGLLENLESLELQRNIINGTIPTEFGGLSELEFLSIERNLVSGPIPSELGQLSLLEDLRLNGTFLTGEMPIQVCTNTNTSLERIQVDCGIIYCECCDECWRI